MALRESDIQVLCTASLQAALLDKQAKLALSLDELHAAEAARAEQVMGRWQVRQLAAIGLGVAACCQPCVGWHQDASCRCQRGQLLLTLNRCLILQRLMR